LRNLSFALTTPQILARTKTVTRRRGVWWAGILRPSMLVCAVEKSQGIKAGALRRLAVLRIVDVRVERLDAPLDDGYDVHDQEAELEGFLKTSWAAFVQMFCKHVGGGPRQIVTRVEFEYVIQQACKGPGSCSQGVMDDGNDHLRGLCRCECHGVERPYADVAEGSRA